jgi:hypothetical protein
LFSDRRCKQYAIDMAAAYECGQSIDIRFGLSFFLTGAYAVGEDFYPKAIGCAAYPSSRSRRTLRWSDDRKATLDLGRTEFA